MKKSLRYGDTWKEKNKKAKLLAETSVLDAEITLRKSNLIVEICQMKSQKVMNYDCKHVKMPTL